MGDDPDIRTPGGAPDTGAGAEALGIGRWKLYDLLRQGRLRSIRIGSCRRISTAALLEFVTELEGEQTGLR